MYVRVCVCVCVCVHDVYVSVRAASCQKCRSVGLCRKTENARERDREERKERKRQSKRVEGIESEGESEKQRAIESDR